MFPLLLGVVSFDVGQMSAPTSFEAALIETVVIFSSALGLPAGMAVRTRQFRPLAGTVGLGAVIWVAGFGQSLPAQDPSLTVVFLLAWLAGVCLLALPLFGVGWLLDESAHSTDPTAEQERVTG